MLFFFLNTAYIILTLNVYEITAAFTLPVFQSNTIEHIISGKYTFSSRMGVTIRVRHYYSDVAYGQFFLLNRKGTLDNTLYNTNHNINFNLFNVDCVYSWWFAPGSQISLTWKNFIQASADKQIPDYFKNLHNTLESPQQNTFSFKILYYLDYLQMKRM
jgi:Domain of unknown function (DUF5916)